MQNELQRSYWESRGKRRAPRHPAAEAFSRPKLEFARRHMPDLGVATVIDIGAGNGFFTWLLEAWGTAIAVDFARTMLEQHPSKRKIQADALNLPFADSSADVVFCGNLLHHLPDPGAAVHEMARVAGRYVVLVEPNRNNPLMLGFGLLKREERGTVHLHEGQIRRFMSDAGLEIVASTTMGSVLPNKTPDFLLPFARLIDGESPLGFYAVAVGRVTP